MLRRLLGIFCVSALIATAAAPAAHADFLDDMRSAPPGELGLNKTTGGALLGAALGGLLGSQIGKGDGRLIGTAVGVLGGAWLGHRLGTQLDEADRLYESRAARNALATPSARSVAWRNPDTGRTGSVAASRPWRDPDGDTCRQIDRSVVIDGRREAASAVACRDRSGNWVVQQ